VPYTEYSIRVQAVNENGPGAFSKDIVIRTHSAQPTQPPHNVTLEAASSTVHWIFEYMTNEIEKEILRKFYVKYVHAFLEYYRKMGTSTRGAKRDYHGLPNPLP
jgi:hypothetical protein